MIISISYTPDEERDSTGLFKFARASSPDSIFWFTQVTVEQYATAKLAIRKAMEAPADTPELLLDVAKGLVGLI